MRSLSVWTVNIVGVLRVIGTAFRRARCVAWSGSCRIERPSVTVEGEPDADAANGHRPSLHGIGRAVSRDRGGACDPARRRQRHRRRRRRRHRARCRAQRPGPVLRRRADADLPRRPQRDRVDRGPRLVAEGAQHRDVHPRPQRHDPRGPPAHGGSGGARRLDPGAATLRHHELRRGRGGGHPLCARRLCRAHRHGDVPAGQGRGLPALAAERRDLAARRQAARRRRPAGAGRSRPHDPVHGRPGEGGGGQGPRCRPDGGARRLLSRRHCPDDREVPPRERRAADASRISPSTAPRSRRRSATPSRAPTC